MRYLFDMSPSTLAVLALIIAGVAPMIGKGLNHTANAPVVQAAMEK